MPGLILICLDFWFDLLFVKLIIVSSYYYLTRLVISRVVNHHGFIELRAFYAHIFCQKVRIVPSMLI